MENSILKTVRHLSGLSDVETVFDLDLITGINTSLTTLWDLGIGPSDGFQITGEDEEWADLIGDNVTFNMVQSYLVICVRLLFDPPASSYAIDALERRKTEMEWRLNLRREAIAWADPNPDVESDLVLDGGGS